MNEINTLGESDVKFAVNGVHNGFTIYHNLEILGLSIESEFVNWLYGAIARKDYSSKSFCEYVIKKDPENIICFDNKVTPQAGK